MNDNNLVDLLLNLFDTSLSQLHEDTKRDEAIEPLDETDSSSTDELLFIKPAKKDSTRVLTIAEQAKMTKASYQYLVQMQLCGLIEDRIFELVLNQIQNSESHIVTLEETKWTIRTILSANLNADQLAFLDLVLYQKEDAVTPH